MTIPFRSRAGRLGACALAIALPVSLVAQTPGSSAAPPAVDSTPGHGQVQQMQAFEVTGSRIKRLDNEGPNPVLVISRDEIDRTGITDVQQFIRKLPQNALSYTNEAVFGFTPGAAGANLRGLGVEYTLTLINGRRAAPYAIGAGGTATFSNTQGIPLSAIDRIEVLTDGASAIYGSDAVAGVINYILKKDFEGFEVTTGYLNTFHTDISTPTVTVTGGFSNPKGSAMISLDWQKRNAQFRRDREWSRSSDHSNVGGLNFLTLGGQQPYGSPAFIRAVNPQGVAFGDVYATSFQSYTTQQLLTRTAGTAAYNAAITDPNTDASVSPETQRYALNGVFTYTINEHVSAYLETGFARIKVNNSVHPIALDSFGETVPGVGNLVVPASNPYNPLGVNRTDGGTPTDVRIWYRMRDLGNRVSDVTDDIVRIVAGFKGRLGQDWTWDAGYQFMSDAADNVDTGHSIRSQLRNALRGTTTATAYNVFGAFSGAPGGGDPQAVLSSFAAARLGQNTYDTQLFDATFSGSVYKLPAGDIGLAGGAEYRRDKLSQVRDPASANGDFTASGGSTNLFGRRHATSYFAEARVPLIKQVELGVAGRHEDYSDFGHTTNPKYSIAVRPMRWVLLRGSYAEGFRAPALIQLFQAQSIAFQSTTVVDPLRRNPANPSQAAAYTSLKLVRGGNPDLTPETSKSYYGGIVVEPTGGLLKGLSFSLDWSNIYVYERIQLPSVGVSLRENDPNIVVRAPATAQDTALNQPGEVTELRLTYQNLARRTTEGLDFGVNYRWTTQSLGRFDFEWRGSWLYKFVTQSSRSNSPIENRGSTSLPEWRWIGGTTWRYKRWTATFTVNYVGQNDAFYQTQVQQGTLPSTWLMLGPWTTYDVQATYDLPWIKATRLTVGIDNVTDRPPPFYDNAAEGYDPLVANPFGAMYYVKLTKRF